MLIGWRFIGCSMSINHDWDQSGRLLWKRHSARGTRVCAGPGMLTPWNNSLAAMEQFPDVLCVLQPIQICDYKSVVTSFFLLCVFRPSKRPPVFVMQRAFVRVHVLGFDVPANALEASCIGRPKHFVVFNRWCFSTPVLDITRPTDERAELQFA